MAERSSPNLLALSLVAGLTGAAAALLLAPRSGKDTRKKLQEQADQLKEKTHDGLHEVKDTVSSGLDKFSTALSTTGKKLKEDYEDLEDLRDSPRTRQSPVLHAWEEEV